MARKVKGQLPSGNIRRKVYMGKDETGKPIYKSVTGRSVSEVNAKVQEIKNNRQSEKQAITVLSAMNGYIDIKSGVLSPSTIVGYKRIVKNYILDNRIGKIEIGDITKADIQKWISELSVGLSPKTVSNASGLLRSTLDMYGISQFKVTLPARKKADLYCPSSDEISTLINYVRESGDQDMLIAILLAAFGPLRRGEICALTSDDIKGSVISVNKAMVLDEDRMWQIKSPKTYSSYRSIEFPDFVMKEIKGRKGRIINRTPDAVSEQFARCLQKAGLQHFRFHDLRHYSASIMHAIGVPDVYILGRGGWSSDYVMKSVYRNSIDNEAQKQTTKILDYFKEVGS